MTHIHTPTGKPCTIVRAGAENSFCNFGDVNNPFATVPNRDLSPIESAPVIDFRYVDHGSIILLSALSKAANEWANNHLPEDVSMFGPAFAIERRHFADILDAIDADGLTTN